MAMSGMLLGAVAVVLVLVVAAVAISQKNK